MATRAKKRAAGAAAQAEPAAAAAPQAPAPLPGDDTLRLHGSLDRVDPDGVLEGWAWSPDQPDLARPLVILVDQIEVARLRSDTERPDLVAAGVGNGCHAFRHVLDPGAMRPGGTSVVLLRDLLTRRQVGGSVTVQWGIPAGSGEPQAGGARLSRLLSGTLDRVSRDGWVSGWCWYPDYPDEHVELNVLVDGEIVGSMRAANYRPDLQHAGIGDGNHGFSFALPYAALADKGTLRVAVQDARTGRNLADPITMRLGRMAAAEDRIQDLERQLRLLRGHLDDLTRQAEARDEDRASRELFATVAAFFQDLAQGGAARGGREFGAAGLSGALEEVAGRYAVLTLAVPEQATATICIAATASFDALYRCLTAVHEAGLDRAADIVVLDDGQQGGYAALLPSVVRNLRYLHVHDGGGLMAGRNEIARIARGSLLAFLAPELRVLPGWLDEMAATFEREPEVGLVGGRLVREDGLLHHTGLLAGEDGSLRDTGHLAPAERSEHRFLRRVDAVAGLAFAVRRDRLLDVGGFSALYQRFGHAVADLCARLRAAGHPVLYQPLAAALWVERSGSSGDGDAPDLTLPDEQTLRLRERMQHEGWPAGPASARFAGHALVIDDDLPRPDRDAGSIATFEQMVLLRRLGWRVTFCPVHALALEPAETDRLARHGIEVAGPPQIGSVTQYLQAEGQTLDLVHIYRYSNAAMLLDRVRELAPSAKIVFATADLHFLREQRRAELSGQEAGDAAREEELRCMRAADATIITSDHEMAVLQGEIEPGKLVLLRWITRPQPLPQGFAERRDLCFVGNFRHAPNADGVQWFLQQVMPLLRARLPGVRLKLAGSDMPPLIRELATDGVEVLGWVEDLATLFGAVRLSVAPLRFGAGFKGKVATSLAYGLPVVGSSISLEGTGLAHGDGVAVADTPEDFAREIVRLHEDADWWRAMSERGVERVATLYSPAAAGEVWRRMLERLGLAVGSSAGP